MVGPAKQKGPRLVLVYLTYINIYIQQKEKYKTKEICSFRMVSSI
jgi:hypothetical protein